MGLCRFLYQNLIPSESAIAVSSLRNGIVTVAIAEKAGSAVLTPSGNYSGAVDKEFTVQIDSVAGGNEITEATFRWSDGGGSWDATGVATSTSPTLLGDGVSVAFTAGAGNDFELNDLWYFKAINLFNAGKMLDLNRDARYRSAALESPNTITVDLGSAQEIKALALWDHNLTASATITLMGNSADSWTTPAFSESVTWNSETIIHYLSTAQTYRYWRIAITDTTNPDGYIEIGELYLGSYLEFSRNFKHGPDYPLAFFEEVDTTPAGKECTRFWNFQEQMNIQFGATSETDKANLDAMITALNSRATGIKKPLWWNENSANPNDTWMVNLALTQRGRTNGRTDMWDFALALKEAVKTNV